MRFLLWLRRAIITEEKNLLAKDLVLRRMLRRRPFIYAILGGTGVILFWRGVWELADRTPIISNPVVSIFVGLGILAVTGLLVFQLIGQAALNDRIDDLRDAERHLEIEEKELAQKEQSLVETERSLERELGRDHALRKEESKRADRGAPQHRA